MSHKRKTRGSELGMKIFSLMLNKVGLQPAYCLLYFVAIYYLIFDIDAIKGAKAYLEKRFPNSSYWKMKMHIYKLFISQGKQLIDRAASLSGAYDFKFDLIGLDEVTPIIESDKGAVVVTAHAGNWQIALPALSFFEKSISIVMHSENNKSIKNTILSLEKRDISVILSDKEMGGVVQIMNAVSKGHLVPLMGDRVYDFDSVSVNFVGHRAEFPYGAFMIAAANKVPVITLLASKTGKGAYTVEISGVMYPIYNNKSKKKEQLKKWVQKYADSLSSFVEKHPYQCFLFQDVWKNNKKGEL